MNKTLRLLIIGWLLSATTLTVGAWATRDEQVIIIVHTGESKTFHYNPVTHGELRQEMADGGMMLSVVPKEVLEERRRVLGDEVKPPALPEE